MYRDWDILQPATSSTLSKFSTIYRNAESRKQNATVLDQNSFHKSSVASQSNYNLFKISDFDTSAPSSQAGSSHTGKFPVYSDTSLSITTSLKDKSSE